MKASNAICAMPSSKPTKQLSRAVAGVTAVTAFIRIIAARFLPL
jgi:hypothetical protein